MLKMVIILGCFFYLIPEVVEAKVHGNINSTDTRSSFAISRDGDDSRLYKKMKAKLDFLGRKTILQKDGNFRLMCSLINCSSFVIKNDNAEISFEDDYVYYRLEDEAAYEITQQFKLEPNEEWKYVSSDEKLRITATEKLFIFQYGEK